MPECTLDDKDPLSLYLKKAPMVRTIVTKNDHDKFIIDFIHTENNDDSKFHTLSEPSISKNVSEQKLFNCVLQSQKYEGSMRFFKMI